MKLAIPVESKSLDAPVCPSFGRTPYYALYDTETGTSEFLDNAAASSQGGAGIKAAQILADSGAEAVITYRCGENAAQVLDAAKIDLYKAQDGTVMENIEKFKSGALSRLSEISPGLHNHGGSANQAAVLLLRGSANEPLRKGFDLMKIAVLSGKGGTGKTFISVNLACAAGQAVYLDCDVEEPNGHLFLKPEITQTEPVAVAVPEIDMSKCTHCRRCVEFCRYNALALLKDRMLIFNEVCHSCGGCILFCPEKALSKTERAIGTIEEGASDGVTAITGRMNTGEESGIPIVKRLLEKLPEEKTAVIDCPPGSACIVMESIRDADFCILVAEPTLFGAHNLAMVYELVKLFDKPFGAVLNKCMDGENPSEFFCEEKGINILARIPYDEKLGRLISEGRVAARESEPYRLVFRELLDKIIREARQ